MDVKKVASAMIKVIPRADKLPDFNPEFGTDHLLDMCFKIHMGIITGEKAHRWIGYIQGCVCVGGGATLEELKQINRDA